MVIAKETVRLRYYELREVIDCHTSAVEALAHETGQDTDTIERVLAEEVSACA
jgi:hypothetical protein